MLDELRVLTGLLPDLLVICNEYAARKEYQWTVPCSEGSLIIVSPEVYLTFAIEYVAFRDKCMPTALGTLSNIWFVCDEVMTELLAMASRWKSFHSACVLNRTIGALQPMLDTKVAEGKLKAQWRGPLC